MNRRPGQTRVTTEVAFCSFCGRPRNLRREEHQLGALVRTIVTCESCHRTLSSSMGVTAPEPVAEKAPAAAPAEPEAQEATAPKRRRAPAKKPATAGKAKAAATAPAKTKTKTKTKAKASGKRV